MSLLRRSAVTVTRKQPYIHWANSFEDGGPELTRELAEDRRTIYLVSESAERVDLRTVLDEHWDAIFEEELALWTEKEDEWPSPRTRHMFDAWFDVAITDTVIDLVPDEPLTEAEAELVDLGEAFQLCAWCDLEIEEGLGRFVSFKLEHRDRFAHRAGLTLPVYVGHNRKIIGVLTPEDSQEAVNGEDLAFRACSSRCEKALRKVVPKALKRMPAILE